MANNHTFFGPACLSHIPSVFNKKSTSVDIVKTLIILNFCFNVMIQYELQLVTASKLFSIFMSFPDTTRYKGNKMKQHEYYTNTRPCHVTCILF